jgi:hypothetical protein
MVVIQIWQVEAEAMSAKLSLVIFIVENCCFTKVSSEICGNLSHELSLLSRE